MTRVRAAVLIALAACMLALPSAAVASPATTMVEKINQVRHQHGLPSVRESASLMHSAAAYAHEMMATGYFGHASRIHASHRFRTLGEIIELHRGASPAIGQTINSWMGSPEHRMIILMGQFKFAGAGYVTGNFQGRTQTIWVMHFGRH